MGAHSAELVNEAPAKELATLFELSPAQAFQYWDVLEPFIGNACHHSCGMHTPASVRAGIAGGVYLTFALVLGRDVIAVMICEVRDKPDGESVFVCLLASGSDVGKWLPFEDILEDRARELGCSSLRLNGRKGWPAKLRHWDLLGTYVVLEKRIG